MFHGRHQGCWCSLNTEITVTELIKAPKDTSSLMVLPCPLIGIVPRRWDKQDALRRQLPTLTPQTLLMTAYCVHCTEQGAEMPISDITCNLCCSGRRKECQNDSVPPLVASKQELAKAYSVINRYFC